MLVMGPSTAFKFMGGATWLDLLATSGRTFGVDPIERLGTPDDLRRWLDAVGLGPAEPVSERDRAAAIALREALREAAMSAVAHRECERGAVAMIDAAIARSSGSVRLGGGGVRTAGGALGLIARQAVLTLVGPDRAMLKQCAEHDCRWVFLDPGGRRKWCPEPTCATRGRVRAYRARATSSPRLP